MPILIFDSTLEDLQEMMEVSRIVWLDTYVNEDFGITREVIERRFETKEYEKKMKRKRLDYQDPNKHTLVARDGKKMCGFCKATKEKKNGRIDSIYVLPNYQGKGIGRKLIEKALEWLGETDVFVNVACFNLKAIGFYQKLGFIKTGKEGLLDRGARLPFGKVIPEIEMARRKA